MRRTPLLAAALGAALIIPAAPATSVEEMAASTISRIALTTPSGEVTEIAEAGLESLEPAPAPEPEETFVPGGLEPAPDAPVPAEETATPEETATTEEAALEEAAPTEAATEPAATTEPEPAVEPEGLPTISGGAAAGSTSRFVLETDPDAGGAPVTAEPDVAVRTEPIATDEFTVAALTWDGAFDPAATNPMYVRLYSDGEWSEWSEVGADEAGPDGSVDGGTDPIITGGSTAIQVEIHGSAAGLPANLQLAIVPEYGSTEAPAVTDATDAVGVAPDASAVVAPETDTPAVAVEQPADTAPTVDLGTSGSLGGGTAILPQLQAAAALPPGAAPTVITRTGWGADPSLLDWTPVYATLRGAIVHHTAGTNDYTRSQSASIVRGIYSYHAVTRGWGDIGYNFLVDKYGQVYEGRYGTLLSSGRQMVVGGHARPYNTGTLGISVMGNYVSVQPSLASIEQVSGTIAWRFTVAGVNPNKSSGLVSQGLGTYASGRTLPSVMAHREVASTACPGDAFYSGYMQSIRVRVTNGTVSPLTYYLENQYDPIADVSFPFAQWYDTPVSGDWNGDGRDSVGARRGISFTLTNLTGGKPSYDIQLAYGNPGDVLYIGDWNGDRRDSLMVQRGTTFYVRNSLTTGVAERVFSYGDPGDEVLVGDWNGDGVDTLAVRRGNIFFIRNSLTTGVAEYAFLYGDPGDEVLVGDWNGDGVDTIAVRRENVFHVRNTLTSGRATTVFSFGNPGDSVLIGDWDGNGTDTFGVTRPAW